MISSVLLFPYYLTLKMRNSLYDKGKKSSTKYDIPIISVGNVTVGGTGKTPMVEYITTLIQSDCKIAVLSRGYKRKGKGFTIVSKDDIAAKVGDEPLQIKRKFPEITVAVDKDRNRAVSNLIALPEEERPNVIVLDDGFQYRQLTPSTNIVLIDYNRPIFKDNLLPIGRLRDLPQQIRRADVIVFTKSPQYLDQWQREKMRKLTRVRPTQQVLFATIRYADPQPVFRWNADKRYIYSKEAFLFSGIADDHSIVVHLSDRYDKIAHKTFGDHHDYSRADIREISNYARRNPRSVILTTEKDAQRLLHNSYIADDIKKRLFYIPITTEFLTHEEAEKFEAIVRRDLPEKQGYGLLF